jgi:pantetheine-phosphate adenylyltransferase
MTKSDSRVAVYTGSFDPITLGHLNVIERAATLVDRLIVGIGINVEKPPLFSPDERVDLVHKATAHLRNVEVRAFANLAVEFVRECGARVMIRGVRPLTDLAGEFTMMMANKHLDPGIETVFLMSDEEFSHGGLASWLCSGRGFAAALGPRRLARQKAIAATVARDAQQERLQLFFDALTDSSIRDAGIGLQLPPLTVFA